MTECSAQQVTPEQLREILLAFIPARKNLLIKGAPGTAKTSIVEQVAAELEYDYWKSHTSTKAPPDYGGYPWMQGDTPHHVPFADLQALIGATSPIVANFDDLGHASLAVQKCLAQILGAREINGHRISDLVSFVATTNRKTDKSGVEGMMEMLKSRFVSIVELVPDWKAWVKWAVSNPGLDIRTIAFIQSRPDLLWDFVPSSDLVNSPSPRTVEHVSDVLSMGLSPQSQFAAITGAAGEGFAIEITAWLEIHDRLPHPDLVLNDPEHAEVPSVYDTAVLSSLCSALAARATVQNADRLWAYAMRLPAEFSVLLKQLTLKKCPGAVNSRGYVIWNEKFAEIGG